MLYRGSPLRLSYTAVLHWKGGMAGEKELQQWCVKQAERGTLVSAIQGSTLADGWRHVWLPPPDACLDLDDCVTSRAVDGIQRICTALLEAELVSANVNLDLVEGEEYKPDLLLHNSAINAYILIELKVGRSQERQAIAELLAYAEVLRQTCNDPEIHLVVASQVWRPLLRSAAAGHIRTKGYPLLPLILTPIAAAKGQQDTAGDYEFAIHWDVLRDRAQPSLTTPDAFVCDTATFTFRQCSPASFDFSDMVDRLMMEQAAMLAGLAAQAERPSIGFVIVWQTHYQSWNVTTCILNPARIPTEMSPSSPVFRYHNPDVGEDGIPYGAWEPSNIDTGFQLLSKVKIDDPRPEVELSGFTNWPQAQLALRRWRARLLFAAGWSNTQSMFDGAIPVAGAARYTNLDLRLFSAHHPFRWIPQLDRLTGADFRAGDLSQPSTLCELSAILGEVTDYYACGAEGLDDTQEFGFLAATARLIDAWDQVCGVWDDMKRAGSPRPLQFERSAGTRPTICNIDVQRIWCTETLCKPGDWHLFAFHLGFAQAFAERREILPSLPGITSLSMIETARHLMAWADMALQAEHDLEALEALVCIRHQLQGEPLAINALRWRQTCACLALLADAAVRHGYAMPCRQE